MSSAVESVWREKLRAERIDETVQQATRDLLRGEFEEIRETEEENVQSSRVGMEGKGSQRAPHRFCPERLRAGTAPGRCCPAESAAVTTPSAAMEGITAQLSDTSHLSLNLEPTEVPPATLSHAMRKTQTTHIRCSPIQRDELAEMGRAEGAERYNSTQSVRSLRRLIIANSSKTKPGELALASPASSSRPNGSFRKRMPDAQPRKRTPNEYIEFVLRESRPKTRPPGSPPRASPCGRAVGQKRSLPGAQDDIKLGYGAKGRWSGEEARAERFDCTR